MVQDSSPGANYFPEAFERDSYRLGVFLACDRDFYLMFCRYLLCIRVDLTQLVHFRENLLKEAKRILWNRRFQSISKPLWVALSLCTDRYFHEIARLYNWPDSDADQVLDGFYELLSRAFLSHVANRQIDIEVLRSWSSTFFSLQARTAGPYEECSVCTSQCRYQYDALQLVEKTSGLHFDFESSLRRTDTQCSVSAAWFARLATERAVGQHQPDLSYCVLIHLLRNGMINAATASQVNIYHVREHLSSLDEPHS